MLQRGAVFAGYTIAECLGIGGMGVVYLARHPRLERLVALKVLNDGFAADVKARAAFDREAALAARLDHPNIVAIYDRNGPEDSGLWLSMRYIDGGDAAGLLDEHPEGLDPVRAVRLIADAADALDYAHQQGVLHRDVKPANLLLEHDRRLGERAVLTDFGIARTFDGATTVSAVMASFGYVAPERFSVGPADHRADIYSLGCTLHELLTGRTPFPREEQAAVIAAHLGDPPPAPTHIRPDLPAGLDAVIAIALAKDPGARYPSCTGLAEAAADALTTRISAMYLAGGGSFHSSSALPAVGPSDSAGDPVAVGARQTDSPPADLVVTAGPVPEAPASRIATAADAPAARASARLRLTRRRLLVGGAIAVPLAAVAVAGMAAVRSPAGHTNPPSTPPLPDPNPADVLTGHTSWVRSVAFSRDGTLLASAGGDKTVRLWDVRGRRPAGPPLAGHTAEVQSVAFSPDGALLASGGFDTTVRLWDVRGRQASGPPLLGHTVEVESVAFSPDGTLLATGSADTTVRLWEVGSRQPAGEPLIGHTSWVRSVAFSPEGTLLASASVDRTVRLWDVRSGRPAGAPLTGHPFELEAVAFNADGTLLAAGSGDGTVQLWDPHSGQPAGQPLTGHTAFVTSVAFSPDGTLLASGSDDRTVWMWDVRSRRSVGQPLAGHTHSVESVAFSPDGSLLATGSRDHTVRLWKVVKPR